jgi:hypothetical protein
MPTASAHSTRTESIVKGTLEPERWIDRLIGAAVAMLLFALALSFAVNTVVRTWPILVACVAVMLFMLGSLALYRRYRGW